MELDAEKLKAAIGTALIAVERNRAEQPGAQQLARYNMQALREKFFIRLFNDLFDNDETYYAQIKDLEIDFSFRGFCVAICKLSPPNARPISAEDYLTLFHNAIRLAKETLLRHLKCYIIPLDMLHFTVVFCLSDEDYEEYRPPVIRALRQAAEVLSDYIGTQIFSSVGNLIDSPRQLGLSYRQAQRCIYGITTDDPVAVYEKLPGADTDYLTRMSETRKEIRKAFEEFDTAALDDALTKIADAVEYRTDDILEIMDIAYNILYMSFSLLPDGETMLEGIFAGTPDGYRSLYQMRDAKSIAAWMRQLRDGCVEHLQLNKHGYKEHVVAGVKSYIRDNLGKRLSLQEVAAVFNFNPNYLSTLFSRYTGTGFVEYITGARISAAKDMMAQGKLHVYEIAERLGFESSFYFSKVFKKAEGISPRDYIHKLEMLPNK
jgi:two-component system response regulator YesN